MSNPSKAYGESISLEPKHLGMAVVGITWRFGENSFYVKPQSNSVRRVWHSLKQRKFVQLELASVGNLSKVQYRVEWKKAG